MGQPEVVAPPADDPCPVKGDTLRALPGRGVDLRPLRGEPPMSGRRHPAQVTSDRLGDAVERWWEKFSGEDRDAIGRIRYVLEEIAEDRAEDQS
jgi:hypothetical protein